jgi:hypothetical protein
VAAAAVLAFAAAAAGRPSATLTVIADGLNNPRGVTVTQAGVVFVAEGGKAGPACSGKATCLGTTAGITRWRNGRKARVVSGLPSLGGQDGFYASGAAGVTVDPAGPLYAAITAVPRCQTLPGLPSSIAGVLGQVVRYAARTGVTRAADVNGAECANNYDKGDRDSSPTAIQSIGPGRQLVVDAGANALLETRDGAVQLVAVLPKTARGAESVPTSVAVGPDGAYYVGELVGRPARGKPRRWEARVWRVVPGQAPTVYLRGFNAISGLAFARDGTLYVTERTINPADPNEARGDVVKVAPDGKRSRLAFGELHFPFGAAVGPDGSLYVSNFSILTDTPPASGPFAGNTGQLVRISSP